MGGELWPHTKFQLLDSSGDPTCAVSIRTEIKLLFGTILYLFLPLVPELIATCGMHMAVHHFLQKWKYR